MAEIILKNGQYSAVINFHGAELKSLKKGDKEYVWQADPTFWGRSAPVLFPFVGAVNEGKFYCDGQPYPMGQHGFARDMDFELCANSEASDFAMFVLKSDETTLAKYPFDFELYISYKLSSDGELKIMWRVINPKSSKKNLEFSIGAHPAFNCILSDSMIRLSSRGEAVDGFTNSVFGTGLLTDKKAEVKLDKGIMKLDEHTFDGDAFVIENSQVDCVELLDNAGEKVLAVKFASPLVGIWSPPGKNAPFLCIEPWYGRADKEGFVGELKDREWNNTLGVGEIFEVEYSIVL